MAKLTTGPIIAEIRGKCGDVVFTRNRGGMFSRAHGVRVAPWNANQIGKRATFATVRARWSNALTQSQRDAWNAAAPLITNRDQLSQAAPMAGLDFFVQCNFSMALWWGGWHDNPPRSLAVPDCPLLTIAAITSAPQLLTISLSRPLTPTEAMIIWGSKRLSPGTGNFARKTTAFVLAYSTSTYPLDITTEYTSYLDALVSGKRVALRGKVLNSLNGLYSGWSQATAICA